MELRIFFDEIANYVAGKFVIRPQLKCIDDRTIELTVNPGRFIPTVTMQLKVEEIRPDVICLSYTCSKALSMIIGGAVNHLEQKLPDVVQVNTDDRRVNLYPGKSDKLRKAMEHVRLQDIRVANNGILVVFTLL